MKRKLLILPIMALLLGASACNKVDNSYALYKKYIATLPADDQPTYQEWLDSMKGEKGQDGVVPDITIGNNDHFYIDGVDTGVTATGPKGEQGDKGEKGYQGEKGETGDNAVTPYELYISLNPDYQGTEQDWLNELANGLAGEQIFHTVSFNTDGGSEIASQSILHGEKAVKPENPVKGGFIFTGWTYQNEPWNFHCSITENIELIANYI